MWIRLAELYLLVVGTVGVAWSGSELVRVYRSVGITNIDTFNLGSDVFIFVASLAVLWMFVDLRRTT